MNDDGAVAAAVGAAILLNLRYVAIGVSVAPSLRGRRFRRLAESQLATDESWAISQDRGRVNRERLIGAGLVLFAAWTSGTVAGVFGGSVLGDPATYGFDAMFPALFLALLVGQLGDGRARMAALAGALIALALTPVGAARRPDRRGGGGRPGRPAPGAPGMSATWLIVCSSGAATVALKGLAPVLLGERELPAPVTRVSGALAPALLAALVVVQTVGDGQALTVDPRSPASPPPPWRCSCGRRCSSCSRPPPASPPRSTRSPERAAALTRRFRQRSGKR